MSRVIWKYSLGPMHDHSIVMPCGAEVLHADVQGGEFFLWAAVDPEERKKEERCFLIAPTGGDPDPRIGKESYISTIFDQRYVWHVFEV